MSGLVDLEPGTKKVFLEAIERHKATHTPVGPPYCHACSEAIGDWVKWTPEHVLEHLLPLLKSIDENARQYERAMFEQRVQEAFEDLKASWYGVRRTDGTETDTDM